MKPQAYCSPLQLIQSEVYPRLQKYSFQNGEIITGKCTSFSDGHMMHPAYTALPFTLWGFGYSRGDWAVALRRTGVVLPLVCRAQQEKKVIITEVL